ncbi:MAG TPA: hypothetical protein VG370_27205 [Chloroflexota bacterium]|jgi:hypothetical protein|nr:hypothetical protein [Chloroflexota bacterium]
MQSQSTRRRSRPFLERLRELEDPWAREYLHELERWLAAEPEPERARLARELESEDVGKVDAAALELFLSDYFRSRSWSAKRHPPLEHTGRVPDFAIETGSTSLYAEAVLGQDAPAKQAQMKVWAALADELDAVTGPFDVFVTPTGPWDGRFSRSKVRRSLEQQLREMEGQADVDQWTIEYTLDPHLPLQFEVTRVPDVGPVVGGWAPTGLVAQNVTTHETLYDRIDKKAARYGELDRPYVVFVRAETEFPLRRFSIERALYGTLRLHYGRGADERATLVGRSRSRDGIFTGRGAGGRPVRTRVSAVGVYRHFSDGRTINRHELVIYHNPNARLALDPAVFADVPQLTATNADDGSTDYAWTAEPPEWAAER